MAWIVAALLCFVPFTIQSPLRELLETDVAGLNEETLEGSSKHGRDSAYLCPFSHPTYLQSNSTTYDVGIPPIPDPHFFPVRSKRTVQFKTKYVDHSGNVLSYKSSHPQIRVDATVHVSDYALQLATETIKKMTQHMPAYIFNSCASNTKVGVFTKAESLTVFPEFAGLAAPAGCGSSCAGHCHTQCTFDGRPYSSLAGVGGKRGVIVEDNVLCNSRDPYNKQANILVHEYAHTIKHYCLSQSIKSRITTAYNNARSNGTWTNSQYAMATEEEYWAVASQTWFNSLHTSYASSGMNVCSGHLCSSANAARWNLYHKDISLYGLLLEVYFNNNPNIVVGMKACTTLH